MYYRCNAGGWNKTHGQVEATPRIDSYDVDMLHVNSVILCGRIILRTHMGIDILDIYIPNRGPVTIELSLKPNGYGGQQTFFICPHCGRRYRYLYLIDRSFVCRQCGRLNYKSQQTRDSMADYWNGMKYMEKHLGTPQWPVDGFSFVSYRPGKPKGMHNSTYWRHLIRLGKYQIRYGERLIADLSKLCK